MPADRTRRTTTSRDAAEAAFKAAPRSPRNSLRSVAPPIIEIIAQRPGQSPEEMERYVTIPIEIAIASTPGLNTVYALMDWPVMIGDWSVPMWASWIGLVVAGGLAFFGLRLTERDAR